MYIKKFSQKISFTYAKYFLLCASLLTINIAHAERSEINWQQGAKLGTIVLFYTAETPAKDLPECLSHLSKEELATKHYVKVSYHHVRLTHHEVAELPKELLHVKLEDHVEIWPENCSNGKLSRVSQVFSATP